LGYYLNDYLHAVADDDAAFVGAAQIFRGSYIMRRFYSSQPNMQDPFLML
jgi:hypothetical protein